jgi:hypothetical protein
VVFLILIGVLSNMAGYQIVQDTERTIVSNQSESNFLRSVENSVKKRRYPETSILIPTSMLVNFFSGLLVHVLGTSFI